ncbi:MAG: hypothetical protein IKX88_14395, partial [Thermoguttaceae bacterium]|nr:hypothetical protein [Thermoguttaceae bacterium]
MDFSEWMKLYKSTRARAIFEQIQAPVFLGDSFVSFERVVKHVLDGDFDGILYESYRLAARKSESYDGDGAQKQYRREDFVVETTPFRDSDDNALLG